LARDIQPQRLRRLRENCERLGVTCVEIAEGDIASALRADSPSAGTGVLLYDRILLDAPCSNSGVLRRRVDLRWRIRAEELVRLRGEQAALLREAAVQLKPGGLLVYSTCSLEAEENETVTRDFLAEHANFTLESERQLLPFRDQVDGAYVAALRLVK
jgi:16S rRNA (cytosine967-C5)-methyltransferase